MNTTSRALFVTMLLSGPAVAQAPSDWLDFVNRTYIDLVSDITLGYSLWTVGDVDGPLPSEGDMIECDVDKDGDLDVVIVMKEPGGGLDVRPSILLINKKKKLRDKTRTKAPEFLTELRPARDVQCADVNGDTWLDLVIGSTWGYDPDLYLNLGRVGGVWQGFQRQPIWFVTEQGNNSFTLDTPPPGLTAGMTTCAVACPDVDNDGDPDVYLANYASGNYGGRNRLLINDGTGFFTEETTLRLTADTFDEFSTGADFYDHDHDGDQDLLLSNALSYYLYFNDGTGVFPTRIDAPPAKEHYMHGVGDFNGDGWIDSYAVGDHTDRTAINDRNGGWYPKQDVPSPHASCDGCIGGNAKAYDMDGDDDQDMLVADLDTTAWIDGCGDGFPFVILRNRYTSPFNPVFDEPNANNLQPWNLDVWDMVALDLDRNGKLDILLFTCHGLRLFLQQ